MKNIGLVILVILLLASCENNEKFKKFASDNQLEIKEYKINNLKQNDTFSEGIINVFHFINL